MQQNHTRARAWRTGWVALSLFALLAAPALPQAPPFPDLHPLVELHDTHVLAAGPALISSMDQNVLITHGGTLVAVQVTRHLVSGASFETEIAQGAGSAADLTKLEDALAAADIRPLGGVCSANLFPLGSSFHLVITWYGRNGRTAFLTMIDGPEATPPCTPAQTALASAILAFETAVLADPTTIIQRSGCLADIDCAGGLLCCPACAVPNCEKQCTVPRTGGGCPLIP
jgi:hypothetical protein